MPNPDFSDPQAIYKAVILQFLDQSSGQMETVAELDMDGKWWVDWKLAYFYENAEEGGVQQQMLAALLNQRNLPTTETPNFRRPAGESLDESWSFIRKLVLADPVMQTSGVLDEVSISESPP